MGLSAEGKVVEVPSLWVQLTKGELTPLDVAGYPAEKEFQELLADRPEVLASALDGPAAQWLLIGREVPIKAEESDVGTWQLDHLFVGSDCRPVLVEVKRSSNPEARRQVVAQMLDYAASFEAEWSADRIRRRREQRDQVSRDKLLEEMERVLAAGSVDDEDQFWTEVQTQIDAGRIRLLFVADQLSTTLKRIIEYLNNQLRTTEVLGVEVVRHAPADGAGPLVFQPIVHGRSTTGGAKKGPAERITGEEFAAAVVSFQGEAVLAAVESLIDALASLDGFSSFGTGSHNPALYLNLRTKGAAPVYWPYLLKPRHDKFIVRIRKLRTHPVFSDDEAREALVAKVESAFGEPLAGSTDGDRWAPMSKLKDPEVLAAIKEVLEYTRQIGDGVGG